MRPAWLIRLGLWIYDLLAAGGSLPRTRRLDLATDAAGVLLSRRYAAGFEYSDCTVDDARLVVLNALDAAERGATIRTGTRCVRADRSDVWTLVLNMQGRRSVATARALVNCTGPWAIQFSDTVLRAGAKLPVRLVKGSHILVRALFDHGRAYIFQNKDRRITFAIPYDRDFTLIGTTDNDFVGDPEVLAPQIDEIEYLCAASNAYFRESITPADVVWAYSGVRLLYDDRSHKAQDIGRDHVLALDAVAGRAPLLNIYGGKLTTYRRVAEEAIETLANYFTAKEAWTGHTPLPGGDFDGGLPAFTRSVKENWPFLDARHVERLAAAYGTRVAHILRGAVQPEDLGPRFGADLTAAEVRYLMRHEWARTADDVLWRRTRLGLRVSLRDKEALAQFMAGATGTL
jgi:glycerol-3-phosphate dehydrogenase